MKKYSPLLVLAGIFIITFFSCKKINESTELGDGLIPAVDNVTTFDTSLVAVTSNMASIDSIRLASTDYVAAGHINDGAEFGTVHADFQFGIAPATVGIYPYYHKDSVSIDSVVLSLAYVGGYGDTAQGTQTFKVFEIAPSSGFRHDSNYRYDDPNSFFSNTGVELGSKTFQVNKIKNDSFYFKRNRDSFNISSVVRIPLNNSLGTRLVGYDTSFTSNGGYRNDSIFRTLFKGFSIQAEAMGNVVTYFDLNNQGKTRLTVYYKVNHTNGTHDTLAYDYFHTPLRNGFSVPQGKTNYVNITRGGNWLASLSQGADEKLYLQGAPSGSYGSIVFPALDNLGNKVIHRAELIATRIPSAMDNILMPPARLYLDRFRKGSKDTSMVFEKDINIGLDGSISFGNFGGSFKNNAYTFNITRYVQGIVTRQERNDTLRLYAPFETLSYVPGLGFVPVAVSGVIYNGRVVLAGGSYPDPKTRLRLRIIYSNL